MKQITLMCPKCESPSFDNQECPLCVSGIKIINDIPLIESRATRDFLGYAEKTGLEQYKSQSPSPPSTYWPRYIPDGARIVLDVGGGDGNALALYAKENPYSQVFVCDADITNLARVPLRNIGNLQPFCCQADLLPFEHGAVSSIFSLFMVEHLDDYIYSNFLLKAYELLEPGGSLIVASDSAFYDKYIHPVERLVRKRVWRTTGFLEKYDVTKVRIHHHNLKTPTQAEQFIAKHGFFVQDLKRHLIGGRHTIFGHLYEIFPRAIHDLLSTMYVVVAKKPRNKMHNK